MTHEEVLQQEKDEVLLIKQGIALAEIFGLKKEKSGMRGVTYYRTSWGTKTPMGLALTVQRLGEMVTNKEKITT